MDRMRRVALILVAGVLLTACDKIQRIHIGQKADGSPRMQIPLTPEARREAAAARAAAYQAQAGAGTAPGMPIQPKATPEVMTGPVTVGLRHEGVAVIAGKAVPDEQIADRLSWVRAERTKAGSADVAVMTVLAPSLESQNMSRVMHAMSCGYQAGFTKIGYQVVDSIPLPPETEGSFPAASLPSGEGRLIVSVAPDGALRLDTESSDLQALQGKLQEAVSARQAKSLPAPAVTVLADKDAPLDAVQAVLTACKTAGITAVTLGSPVPVAAAGMVPNLPPDVSEAFRNWRLGLESRDVDFSEGAPGYWYGALFHAWMDDADDASREIGAKVLNRERVRFLGANAFKRLDQMAHLLTGLDAARGGELRKLSSDLKAILAEALSGTASLDAARFQLGGARRRVAQEFGPETVVFPPGFRIPPPEKPEDKKEEEKHEKTEKTEKKE